MRLLRLATAACLFTNLLVVASSNNIQAQVAKEDIHTAQSYLDEQASPIDHSVEKFKALTQPYAPLDFQVRNGTNENASALRNYLFGVASAIAGLESTAAPKMANDFHCGEPCATARIQEFVSQHEKVSALVMRFVPLTKLAIVARWGIPGDLRINDTFLRQGSVVTYTPSGKSGVVPNSNGKVSSSLADGTGLTSEELSSATSIAAELSALHLAAIVRSPQGIRVIRTGNADNQCGLLFKMLSAKEPKQGDSFGEGLDVNGVTMLAKDIYYFETN